MALVSRWRSILQTRRHTTLLVAIVTLFALRPVIGDAPGATVVFNIAIMVLLILALYTVQVDELVGERETLLAQRKRRSRAAWVLGGFALGERLLAVMAPSMALYRIASITWLLFFAFITWTELRAVLKQKEITSETISMSISVYLLLGLTWGLLYIMIFQYHPQAFNFASGAVSSADVLHDERRAFPVFIYFSLTTLSTVGYGDITPVSLQARYAAVAEGITGQFYLAILVARLVGMQMSRAPTPSASKPAAERRIDIPER